MICDYKNTDDHIIHERFRKKKRPLLLACPIEFHVCFPMWLIRQFLGG